MLMTHNKLLFKELHNSSNGLEQNRYSPIFITLVARHNLGDSIANRTYQTITMHRYGNLNYSPKICWQ